MHAIENYYLIPTLMKKKLLLSVLLAVLCTLVARSQGEYTTLVVELNNGSSVNYILKQKPTIKMGKTDVIVTTGDNNLSATYNHADVKQFYFKEFDRTAIEENITPQKVLKITYVDGENVRISGTEANDRISLYTIDGQMMQNHISANDEETIVHIGSLEKGIYIIQLSNKQSFKVVKR